MYRVKKANSLIKKELSKIILKDVDFPADVLVTLTRVDISLDFSRVNVFISTMPYRKSNETISILNDDIYFLQKKLNKRLKMRPVPKVIFKIEKETIKAGRVEEALEIIRKEDV